MRKKPSTETCRKENYKNIPLAVLVLKQIFQCQKYLGMSLSFLFNCDYKVVTRKEQIILDTKQMHPVNALSQFCGEAGWSCRW
jgi:hypothetical protein